MGDKAICCYFYSVALRGAGVGVEHEGVWSLVVHVTMLGSHRWEMRWCMHWAEVCTCERLCYSCVECAGSACTYGCFSAGTFEGICIVSRSMLLC